MCIGYYKVYNVYVLYITVVHILRLKVLCFLTLLNH